MRRFRTAVAAAVLAGAGALVAPSMVSSAAAATPQTVAFGVTGGEQQWVVPAGVTSVRIAATGAGGGSFSNVSGGAGALATGTVPVTPGTVLYVEVGGKGVDAILNGPTAPGGFNGGGAAPQAYGHGGSGGGASDVRTVPRLQGGASLPSRLLTAAGGGGAGGSVVDNPGRGGAGDLDGTGRGADGLAGTSGGAGAGATQTAPGPGGGGSPSGQSGQPGVGGDGVGSPGTDGGGGGGGGVYGGGGGARRAGGGGGSSGFAVGATDLRIGPATGPASVTITWTPPTTAAPSAPDTTITKAPKKKSAKKKASVVFTGTAGATFECSLDGGAFAACASPYKATVKRGKHTIAVRAVLAGVPDPSPATARFKVVRRGK